MMTPEVVTPEVPGNTKAGTTGAIKARAFQFTLNQVGKYYELLEDLTNLKTMDYLISCEEEAPTTGHKHIHIYAHFRDKYRLSKKIMSHGAHIEICKGSPKQNIEYIRKDGKILDEIGEVPHQGARTVKELKEIDNPDELNWNEYNTWKKLKSEEANEIKITDWYKPDIKVTYIWGDSGVGKSKYAKDKCIEEGIDTVNVVKHNGDFWIGVGNAKCAIYDDFRPSDMKPSEFINFIDYNKHTLNIKGGSRQNEYTRIFITSVIDPQYMYSGMVSDEPRKQWMRRMEIIHLE